MVGFEAVSYSNKETKIGIARVNELAKREDTYGLISELRSGAEDGTISVRAWAARKLGELRAPEAAEPLARLLADPDERVQVTALIALGSIASEKAKSILRSKLRQASGVPQRVAAEELGRLRDPDAKSLLAGLLSSSDARLRRSVAVALAAYGDHRLLDQIDSAIRDESAWRRRRIRRFARDRARRQRG